MSAVCPICDNPQDQGLACHACTTLLERELASVRDLMAELDTSISKQARIGVAGSPGLARERTPVNLGAMAAADDLTNTLTTWARDVSGAAGWVWVGIRTTPAAQSAATLLALIDPIRRHPAVAEMVDEIHDAIRTARRAIDRPADRIYLGQCLMVTPDDEGRDVTCLADIYAKPNAQTVTCRTCGISAEVRERRAWLLGQARDRLFTVKEAAQMIGQVGKITVSEDRIRGYLRRGRLAYHPIGDKTRGIRLGDLLTIVIDDSEKRGAA